jgi:hypothetical protein
MVSKVLSGQFEDDGDYSYPLIKRWPTGQLTKKNGVLPFRLLQPRDIMANSSLLLEQDGIARENMLGGISKDSKHFAGQIGLL